MIIYFTLFFTSNSTIFKAIMKIMNDWFGASCNSSISSKVDLDNCFRVSYANLINWVSIKRHKHMDIIPKLYT